MSGSTSFLFWLLLPYLTAMTSAEKQKFSHFVFDCKLNDPTVYERIQYKGYITQEMFVTFSLSDNIFC